MNPIQSLHQLSENMEKTARMPVLFLGHGSPMNAIEENQFVQGFRTIAKNIPTPNAILCISAHWYIASTKVTAMEHPKTIHDFGGFPKALFDVEYPAPGSPSLAQSTKDLLLPTPVELDDSWGLDHGAWSVIKHLYPQANIPVIQMSIDYTKPALYHYELAKKLTSLRDKGILIIGSGNIIHNLGLADFQQIDKVGYGYDWAIEAHTRFNSLLVDVNYQALIDYKKESSAIQLAIPTPDHYLPLLYTLALHDKKESITLFNDELLAGSLSMTSVKIG
ncbi:MAG: 4,5-DOPA dioxygenase extradiol [Bacteroidota bacterium]